MPPVAPADSDLFCGCANCESQIVGVLLADPSVSASEALRWALVAVFAGHARLRCAR
jgi:hypothetical protein